MNDQRSLAVPEGLDGERLDAAIARMFGLSRSRAAELISAGNVLVEGAGAAKSDRVRSGAWLEVWLPAPPAPLAPAAEPLATLGIVYEDADLVVIDKPAGVAAHPSPGWEGPTVVGALLAAGQIVAPAGAAERQGIVHRIDAGTTGLMVVAKSELAYVKLKRAFRSRRVDKRYHALVQGRPDPLRGTVDAPLERHPAHEYKWAVIADGKPSVTHYDTVEAFRSAALLDVKIETGRTHQIRVHMAAIHHPCVGDLLYGADPALGGRLGLERQALHAARLGFAHPVRGHWVEFESEHPADLRRAIETLRSET